MRALLAPLPPVRADQALLRQVLDDPFWRVRHAAVKVLADLYHAQIQAGNLIPTLESCWSEIAYLQFGDNPGRKEPGTGEINYRFLFGFIDSIGYRAWIGCEYKPKAATLDGLGWRAAHGI